MIIKVCETLKRSVDNHTGFNIDCTTSVEGIMTLCNRYPQFMIALSESRDCNPWVLLLNGDVVLDPSELYLEVSPFTVLSITDLTPAGAVEVMMWTAKALGDDKAFERICDAFVDPMTLRIAQGKQISGLQGYGWIVPGLRSFAGEKLANQFAGYLLQVAGTIISIFCLPVGAFMSMVGSVSVAMADGLSTPTVGTLNNSATYTFDGVRNNSIACAPVAIVYGEHRIGGQALNVYSRSDESVVVNNATLNHTLLYAQIGLCEGEIEAVSGVQVNKLPITYYNAITSAPNPDYIRLGNQAQDVLPDFSETQTTTSLDQKIHNVVSNPIPPIAVPVAPIPVYGFVGEKPSGTLGIVEGYYKYE